MVTRLPHHLLDASAGRSQVPADQPAVAPTAPRPGCRFCGRTAGQHGVDLIHRFVGREPVGWGHLLEIRRTWAGDGDDVA